MTKREIVASPNPGIKFIGHENLPEGSDLQHPSYKSETLVTLQKKCFQSSDQWAIILQVKN
jgi:hypothetical protein